MIAMLISVLMQAPTPSAGLCDPPPHGDRPWVSAKDYPKEAKRAGMEGDVGFTLRISDQGCPIACTITMSSGYPLLDDTTCRLMMDRARFKPELDANGQPVETSWSHSIHWGL